MIEKLFELCRENNIPLYDIYEYDNGAILHKTVNRSHRVNNLYSVSKTFTSVAVGMLCDKGLLSMDDNVHDLLGREDCPEIWKKVTLDLLLSQRSGVGQMFLDIDTDDIENYKTDDFLGLVLNRPMDYEPGKYFGYSDSNFYLASRIVAKVSGVYMQEFLREELFAPMKFQAWSWAVCPYGHAAGGTGLYLSCKDMLKFGIMMLNGGVYEHRGYISEKWLNQAKKCHSYVDSSNSYGWGMWRRYDSDVCVFSGAFGQVIFLDPENNRVYAWQAYDPKNKAAILLDTFYSVSYAKPD